tara:strand:- start:440 stop:889 length:450 start_codon:yes stop_codon:yes gene_type:complete
MLNLGIYLERLDSPLMPLISQEINRAKSANLLRDVSIFYDDIGPVNLPVNAGFFNATDLWNFTGSLLVFSLPSLEKSIKYINNYKQYYCFGWYNYNVLKMLELLSTENIPTIANSQDSYKNFYRLTSKTPINVNKELVGVVDTILGNES